ncbi:unnamed protein product [Prorocentrum cordatum]|uniref:Cellulase n=1 Tax=Prorocentrum cordatum TaxID=2364126 RepID=A0ABN9TXX9_9DINO|nr:unnamed protein product [Polarella glacialis]
MNRWIVNGGDGFDVLNGTPYKVLGTTRGAMIQKLQRSASPLDPPQVDDRACLIAGAKKSCSWTGQVKADSAKVPCVDTDSGALDNDGDFWGDHCSNYTANPDWCGAHDDDDFTSAGMCCACGGGSEGGVLGFASGPIDGEESRGA